MPGGMGRGARGLDIDGEVVLVSSLAKIVPKSDGGWKDESGQFDRGRLRARCRRPESQRLVILMGVKFALPGQFGHCHRVDRRLCSAGDNRYEVGCLRRWDVFVGRLEDCFGLPSKRYEGDDLEVAADEGVGTRV